MIKTLYLLYKLL